MGPSAAEINLEKRKEKEAQEDPDVGRSIRQIVEARGFVFEKHNVTTEDGYILEMHRVSENITTNSTGAQRPVVFMQHGVMSSSETWVLNGNKSTAFHFARAGYDVWLGNSRGGLYSRKHLTLDPDDPNEASEFFDYSFYEMAKYDTPAQIDYILNNTGVAKLAYIGHSQGTTSMFTALAEGFGEIHKKVNIFVALAPVVYLGRTSDAFVLNFRDKASMVEAALKKMKIYEILGPKWSNT